MLLEQIIMLFLATNTVQTNQVADSTQTSKIITIPKNYNVQLKTEAKLDSLDRISRNAITNSNYNLATQVSKEGLTCCENYEGEDKEYYNNKFKHNITNAYYLSLIEGKIENNQENQKKFLEYAIESSKENNLPSTYYQRRLLTIAISYNDVETLKQYNLSYDDGIVIAEENLGNSFNTEPELDAKLINKLEELKKLDK